MCKMPDLITEFTQRNLLNHRTKELLDIFGYLMAGDAKYLDMNETEMYSYNMFYKKSPDEFEEIIEIESKKKKLIFLGGENSFLISKNTPNVIKAIEDYFINYLFTDNLFEHTNRRDINYIYLGYEYFYNYLNFLNTNTFIRSRVDLNNKSLDRYKIYNDYFIIKEIDSSDDPSKKIHIIQILSTELCLYFIKKNNVESFLTQKGKVILENFKYNIYPIIQKNKYDDRIGRGTYSSKDSTLIPFVCVPLFTQTHSQFHL